MAKTLQNDCIFSTVSSLLKAVNEGKEAKGKKNDPCPVPALPLHDFEHTRKSISNVKHNSPRILTKNVGGKITKRRRGGKEGWMLILCGSTPPNDAYAPFFEEFQSKQAPNFIAVEDLILFKSYAAVSKDSKLEQTNYGDFLGEDFCSLHLSILDRSFQWNIL